jgi:hypothetical protein
MSEAIGVLPAAAPAVTQLSWSQLNYVLLDCDDVKTLQDWLDVTVATGLVTRSVRIYGRLSAVRRAGELKALRQQVVAAQRGVAA